MGLKFQTLYGRGAIVSTVTCLKTDILALRLCYIMASGTAYVVFVIPSVFTVVFGSAVLASALDDLDRELDMWPAKHSDTVSLGEVEILGLQGEYAESGDVEFHLRVTGASFDCGDLEMRIYNSIGDVVVENLYPSLCFLDDTQLLLLDDFSISGLPPDNYTVSVIINAHDNQLIGSAVFQVR